MIASWRPLMWALLSGCHLFTDLEIDWGQAPVMETTPSSLPDLFLGQPVRILAHYQGRGRYPVTLRGRLNGEPVELVLELSLPEESQAGQAVGC